MESNKPRQILYRTYYKNHKKVSLSVSGVNNGLSKQASNLTDQINVHCAKVLWRNLKTKKSLNRLLHKLIINSRQYAAITSQQQANFMLHKYNCHNR